MKFRELYHADIKRYEKIPGSLKRVHYFFRKMQTANNKLLKLWYYCWFGLAKRPYGMELSGVTKVGGGLYLGHPYNITVNPQAVIGKNVNIHKGVTIGQENRGPRKGAPTIGDEVWIGINATIVGNVKIGNDVLIAPNSYVNCDVPDHSVVFGNPCIIKHREHATGNYINRISQ